MYILELVSCLNFLYQLVVGKCHRENVLTHVILSSKRRRQMHSRLTPNVTLSCDIKSLKFYDLVQTFSMKRVATNNPDDEPQ